MDEDDELLERSGKPLCCPDGAVLPRDKKFLWYWQQPLVCNKCGKRSHLTLQEVHFSRIFEKSRFLQINKANQLVDQICQHEKSCYLAVRI